MFFHRETQAENMVEVGASTLGSCCFSYIMCETHTKKIRIMILAQLYWDLSFSSFEPQYHLFQEIFLDELKETHQKFS